MIGYKIIITFISCMVLFACNTDEGLLESICMVGKISYNKDPDAIRKYYYDKNGDILREEFYVDTITYTYTGNKVIKQYQNNKSTWQTKTEYYLNASNTIFQCRTYDADDTLISTYEYFYKDGGYLHRIIQTSHHNGAIYITDLVYFAGNLSEVILRNASGEHYQTIKYDYYTHLTNKANLFPQHIFADIILPGKAGKYNKNMVSDVITLSNDGDTLAHVKYEYHDTQDNNKLIYIENDILNEFENEIVIEFTKN